MDHIPKSHQGNIVYADKSCEECKDLYIGETKQPLNRHISTQVLPFSHIDNKININDHRTKKTGGLKEAIYVNILVIVLLIIQ